MGSYSQKSVLLLRTSKSLTCFSLIQSQKLSSDLLELFSRFVLTTTDMSEAEMTIGRSALERTKQI